MRIAELEARTGVSRHTLRYYEKEGLLQEVARGQNNYRDYPERAVQRVDMLCQLKELGFSLREIREITDALRSNKLDCERGALLMVQKRVLIEQRIDALKKVSKLLLVEQKRLEKSWAEQCGH
ncbi:MAG: MerR family transcriptional regulator [Gammaproteobacteria bacterium]|jgi:DNA-binding transcriptional MerR regulator|nr:MerR family transcriptional regulator [Gammaproteobacteria bacterium]MBQ0774869.1 MerR family transcriptional regulator [Gammaproteobacteria bacterium]